MERIEWQAFEIKPRLRIKAFRTCFEKYVPHGENTYFAGESHPFWEMVYITGGEWGVSADDRIYELKEEYVIFHKPMEFHKIWKPLEEKASCFVCTFDLEGDSKYLEEKVFKSCPKRAHELPSYKNTQILQRRTEKELFVAGRGRAVSCKYTGKLLYTPVR